MVLLGVLPVLAMWKPLPETKPTITESATQQNLKSYS